MLDNDESKYSLCIWGIIHSYTGHLIKSEERKKLLQDHHQGSVCEGLGAEFNLGNIVVNLDAADVVAMVFNTQICHYTSHHDLPHHSSFKKVSRYATSGQITKSVVSA